ncbi:hypothetical protein [Mesobacterium pallidum]|uniref:hypothetical protein n=1 Tax=Mesobacterium pallidum TaxID=2872037 RepID=UPI001EE2B428|nr:hypothetical protein [Mesobacterium pallidum]
MISFALDVINWDAIAALTGIVIAGLGFMINSRLRRQERKSRHAALLSEYRRETIAFSRDFFETVSEALALYAVEKERPRDDPQLCLLAARLSSLADTGRFYFPNEMGENPTGTSKGPAFAGTRRPPLEAILAAHFAVEAMRLAGPEKREAQDLAVECLHETRQPFPMPRDSGPSPRFLLIQARRCYLNAVVPGTFPREWHGMFEDLLGPVTGTPGAGPQL